MRLLAACLLLPLLLCVATAQNDAYEIRIAAKLLELKADERLHVELLSGTTDLQGFKIEVPDGTSAVYLNVLGATADIDLALCDAKLKTVDDLDAHSICESMTARINETLAFTKKDGLKPGAWYVYAGSFAAYDDEEVSFDILLSFNDKPKLDTPALPFAPMASLTPLQRAVAACVMLYTEEGAGGSGTVISASGLILTNRHVIEGEDGKALKRVWVSFTRSAREAPLQTHIAEVLKEDAGLDLALLQLKTDLDGNPIERPDFVWLPLAAGEGELGDELRSLGYPAIGGARSLTSITLTRGVISGFESKQGALQWYKSDCLVSAGNSGGTTINAKGELCGIPTETLHDPETMEFLSYIRPVQAVPKEWRELVK